MAESGTDDATDDEPTSDQHECDCGATFDSPEGLNGHKGHCDEEPDESDSPDSVAQERGFKLIVRADVLQTFLERVQTVVDECKVRLTQDGMSTRAVDPANVCMTDQFVDPQAFESYDVRRDALIGVNLGQFAGFVTPAPADEIVHLDHDPATRTLSVQWGGHSWRMALIDPDSIRQEPDLPDLDLSTEVDVPGRVFNSAVRFADSVSDHMKVTTEIDEHRRHGAVLVFSAEGDTDEYTGEYPDGEQVAFEQYDTDMASSLFSLDYLKDIANVIGADETVALIHGQEFPIKLTSSLVVGAGDDAMQIGRSQYMLAPRIQSD